MENIIENNKLIVEFMGGKTKETVLKTIGERMQGDDIWLPFHGIRIQKELKYHTDWNWLMSVVEKIETLNYDFKILGGNWVIITDIDPDRNEDEEIIEIGGKESKLKAVYTAVIEFINWYNLIK